MSESLDIAQWAKAWEALARQAQSAFAAKPEQSSAGVDVPAWLENLQQANPFAKGKVQSEAVEHLLAGAQGYLGMLQSLANAATGQLPGGMAGFWPGNGFPGSLASPVGNPFAQAMRGFGGQGASGFQQMFDRFVQSAGPMLEKGKSLLNMPAFGHLREKQENLQKTARVFMEYQEQSARYDRLMLKVGEQSFARFQLKLAEREEPGRQIESVRSLYDLWIDAAEEAYAEIALSEEFREIYAGVVNAQMRVRQQVQGEIEKLCNELGMPTRSEVDSIGERLQALRRDFRQFQDSATISGVHDTPASAPPKPDRQAAQPKAKARSSASRASGAAKAAPKQAIAANERKKPTSVKRGKPASSKAQADTVVTRTVTVPAASKPRRRKAATSRRKPTHKASAPRVAAAKSTGNVAKAGKGSFAASIARFARKTKSAASRGGSR